MAQYKSVFITGTNLEQYLQAVMSWLEQDFYAKDEPDRHFWHNRGTISEAFCNFQAMVAIQQDTSEVVAYMIWSHPETAAEIDIIEVKQDHRRRGIFSMMQNDFVERYKTVAMLTGAPIPESEHVFDNAGWHKIKNRNGDIKIYKMVKQSVPPLSELSHGHVVAVCNVDFYEVQRNREKYAKIMQYFPIALDAQDNLLTPIITPSNYDSYVAVYFNGELLVENKARRIFEGTTWAVGHFVLTQFNATDDSVFENKGFYNAFGEDEEDEEEGVEIVNNGHFNAVLSPQVALNLFPPSFEPSADEETGEPSQKKARVEEGEQSNRMEML